VSLRIRYEPAPDYDQSHCRAVLVERPGSGELYVGDTKEEAFRVPPSADVGHRWVFLKTRLPLYARAVALFNGRKNVCSTKAESGTIV